MSGNADLSDFVRGHPKSPKREETEQDIARDQFIASRGDLIEKGTKTEFWIGAVLPAIESLYDKYHEALLGGDLQAMGGVKFAQDLLNLLGGYTQMSRKAIHRIAERNFGKENVLPFEEKKHD